MMLITQLYLTILMTFEMLDHLESTSPLEIYLAKY